MTVRELLWASAMDIFFTCIPGPPTSARYPYATIFRSGSIPWRQHDPSIPVAENSSSGAETGEEVNLTEHKQLEKAVERAEAPTPASRSASESTSDRTWSSSARVCSTGTRARCQVRPAPPGRHEAKRDTFTFEFHHCGYATQEPRLAASLVGPWAESDGAAGRQFGAQARSLPTRTTR